MTVKRLDPSFYGNGRVSIVVLLTHTFASPSVGTENQWRRAATASDRLCEWNTDVTAASVGSSAPVLTCMHIHRGP